MNVDFEHRPCSINHCARHAVEVEHGTSKSWLFAVYYCDEHAREIAKGVPVGPVGVDVTRIAVIPKGTKEPVSGGVTLGAD